jgi:hypothetical protein
MALEEEEADFQTRVRMQGFNLKHKNCLVLQRSELTQKHLGDPGYIKYIVKKENIDVVFVDTHGAFSPKVSNGSGDAYEKWTEIMQPLVSLARGCKIALVLITHTTKYAESSGDTNPNNALTGSSAKQGNSDNILTLFKRGELNISGRTVKGMKLSVEFNESNGLWSLSDDNSKILKPKELLKESIVHTLRASKMPMTKDQIAEIIKDEPFFTSNGAFKNALSELSQHNGVTKMRTSGNLVTYKLEE